MDDDNIDNGQNYEWGRTSADYGKYRDIYPTSLYYKLNELGVEGKGHKVLDIGTGTGVLPRAMYTQDLNFVGIDSSKNQIEEARRLAKNEKKEIDFLHLGAEEIEFSPNTFDTVISLQSWHYFDVGTLLPKLKGILKPEGQLIIVYMYWLPFEDDLVRASENLILKYNPQWSGGNINRVALMPRDYLEKDFSAASLVTYDEKIPFSREGWLGRIRASRGVGATLNKEQISSFDKEHWNLISELRPNNFKVLHQLTIEVYTLNEA